MYEKVALVGSVLASVVAWLYARKMSRRLYRDELTRLPNVAALNRAYARIRRRARPGERVGVLVADVDEFKLINDTYGHCEGDRLLQDLAVDIGGLVGPHDMAVRMHGDEFVVLLPGKRPVEVENAASAVRQGLVRPRLLGRDRVSVRVSVGSASGDVGATTLSELLSAADRQMYRTKRDRPKRGLVADVSDRLAG